VKTGELVWQYKAAGASWEPGNLRQRRVFRIE
jgi:hypothetical protein